MLMCGLFRVVTSQYFTTLAFDSPLGRWQETIHCRQVRLCFQNMDGRLARRIVLKYHLLVGFLSFCCWYSIRQLLVQVITLFDSFWNQKLLLIRWIHKAEIILRLCIYSFSLLCTSPFESCRLYLKLSSFCSRYIYIYIYIYLKFSAHYVPKSTTHKQAETTLRRSISRAPPAREARAWTEPHS